jgi:hypothetical protein
VDRRRDLRTSARTSTVAVPLDVAWSVVASGAGPSPWYVAAAPFVFRGAVDRLVGGGGRRWPAPGTASLAGGDRAGFWQVEDVVDAGPRRRLLLAAAVRAPGRVTCDVTAEAVAGGTRLTTEVRLEPDGVAGWAYLAVDLPAREAVVEAVHRRIVADVTTDAR